MKNSLLSNHSGGISGIEKGIRVSGRNETNETRERPVSHMNNELFSKKTNNTTMRTKDEQIESFKKLWKKEHGVDLTNAQALEYSENLLGFFRALMVVDERIRRWNERLVNEPKGFPLPSRETASCLICHRHLRGEEGWYDQYGIKCRPCQRAMDEGVIPATVATDRKSWFSSDDLKREFGWHHTTVAKKVRIGELKARHIKSGEGHWFYVFLKEENTDLK